MNRRFGVTRITTLLLAFAVSVLAGCGSETESTKKATSDATAAATKAAAPVADELVGTWVGRLGPPPPGSSSEYAPGKLYTMKIHADGTTDVFEPGANLAEPCGTQKPCNSHSIEASGGHLTVSETFSCVDPAEYSYTLKGDRLTTTRVKDDCGAERTHLYDGTHWRRRAS
jgi:hypothetical protein